MLGGLWVQCIAVGTSSYVSLSLARYSRMKSIDVFVTNKPSNVFTHITYPHIQQTEGHPSIV